MISKQHIDTRIAELILLEPSLAGKEKQIAKILEQLDAVQEHIVMNTAYLESLRKELLTRLQEQPKQSWYQQLISSIHLFHPMKQPLLAVGIASVAIIVVASLSYFQYTGRSNPATIVARDARAFGSLAGIQAQLSQNRQAMIDGVEADGLGGGSSISSDIGKMMMYYPEYQFTYRYEGEEIQFPAQPLPVYKRIADRTTMEQISNSLRGKKNTFFPLNDVDINYITMSSRDKRYQYSIDFAAGTAMLNQAYINYPEDIQEYPILDNQENITIAKNFLAEQGISIDHYGEPMVNDSWKQYSSSTPEVRIVFPHQAGNNIVYDQTGEYPIGLDVGVQQFNRQVQSVWNIVAGTKESSAYPLVGDTERLVALAEEGGTSYQWGQTTDAAMITYTLGTPEVIYIQYFINREVDQQSIQEELYVPALRFPVTGGEDTPEYYTKPLAVTVPLVEELVTELEQREDPPVYMLMSEPAVESSVR